MSHPDSKHVVVIGAGIVGVCTAIALQDDGHEVTLVDAGEPGGEQAASYGNGTFITPASIMPMSVPGLWRKVPGYLLDPEGPLVIRWRHLPRLMPWLIRFLLAGFTEARVERTAGILAQLLRDGPERHAVLADRAGVPELIERRGVVHAYPDRAAFEADGLTWRLRRDNGCEWRELSGEALRALVPTLNPAYGLGIHIPSGANCADPGAYVASLAGYAASRGARLVQARVEDLRFEGDRLAAVVTDSGEIECQRAVVAAGIGSRRLAAAAGDRIPLEAERGYHVQLAGAECGPDVPLMPSDGKMANVITRQGLRAAGQVELSRADDAPDWRRADILLRHLHATYPGLPRDLPVRRWQGSRPSTPDGLPVIARSRRCADVFYAFGHGHVGLAAGPKTSEIVAALVTGRMPPMPAEPFAASRFRLLG